MRGTEPADGGGADGRGVRRGRAARLLIIALVAVTSALAGEIGAARTSASAALITCRSLPGKAALSVGCQFDQPTLTTQASIVVGDGPPPPARRSASGPLLSLPFIQDAADLENGFSPGGTITFDVYDVTGGCAGDPLAESIAGVDGNGYYYSNLFHPTQPGRYVFVASYSGDTFNFPVGPTSCSDPSETVSVGSIPTTTTVAGVPNPSLIGQNVVLTATVTPVPSGGSVQFTDGGAAMTSCENVFVNLGTGTAVCPSVFTTTGPHLVEAAYTGSGIYQPSQGFMTQQVNDVTPPPPATNLGVYTGGDPSRICDTRPPGPGIASNQCNGGTQGGVFRVAARPAAPLGSGGSMVVDVCHGAGAACQSTAVVLNVTVSNPTAASYLTVYPTGVPRPTASNVSFIPGDTVATLVEVAVGSNGTITIYNFAGSTDVVVDLEGTVANTTLPDGPGHYHALAPQRICDTRADGTGVITNQCNNSGAGSPLGLQQSTDVQVTGLGGVPTSGVAAVILNVTSTNTTDASYLTVWPAGVSRPVASNLNWVAGQTVPNRVIVPVGSGGQISMYNLKGITDIAIDVNGWFGDGTESPPPAPTFTGITPTRICDTRAAGAGTVTNQCNDGGAGAALAGGQAMTVQVAGTGLPVPSTATGVVVIVTTTDTTASGFLTVWPTGIARPNASDLNWVSGETVSNLVVAELSPAGVLSIYNYAGSADVIVDVVGFYT